MERIAVSSSNVLAIGYDLPSQTLEVEFNNGAVYQYFDVPESLYQELMASDSKGGFLHAQIKGVYRYSRV